MAYENPRLTYLVDQIQQNYTDPKIFAESMALYAKNKAEVLSENFQRMSDLLTLTDELGRFYDINSYIREKQLAGTIIKTGDAIAGSQEFVSIYREYDQATAEQLDLAPMTSELKAEYDDLISGTMLSEDSVVASSEMLLSMTYQRDMIGQYDGNLMTAAGESVPTSQVVNYTQECIGSVQQLSAAYKQIADQVTEGIEEATSIASDFTDTLTAGVTELAATLSGPTTQVLSAVLATGSSAMDKIKAIGSMMGEAAQQALDNSSDSTGKFPGRISIGEYQPCNLSMAMGQADGSKPFKQVATAVKTTCVVVGSLVGKLFKAGVSLCKKAWDKYIDPLVSNRIITQDEKAATNEFDVPSFSAVWPINNLFEHQYNVPLWSCANLFSSTTYQAGLGEYMASWFNMTEEEVLALVNEYIVGDQMLHVQTDFGSMYIRRVVETIDGSDVDCIGMDIFCTPTTAPTTSFYGSADSRYVFPMMAFKFRFENYPNSNTTHWWIDSSTRGGNYQSLIAEIKDYFGLDDSLNVVNKFNNSDFDIKDPSSILAGCTASLMRWSLYMFLRNLVQCPTTDWDTLLYYDFSVSGEYYLGYITSSTDANRRWYRLVNPYLTALIYCGFPSAFEDTWGTSGGVVIFGAYDPIDWTTPSDFFDDINWYVGVRRNNYQSDSRSSVTDFIERNIVILAPSVIPTDPDQLSTNDFIIYGCITSLASPLESIKPVHTSGVAHWDYLDNRQGLRTFMGVFLGGLLSNKLSAMKGAYGYWGVIPPFIPYETTTAMKSQRYHVVTTQEMKKKAQNLTSVIVTGITVLAVATASVILKAKLKKFGKIKLTSLAANSEALRYLAEDVYNAYQGREEYDFPNNRIPTDQDKEDANTHQSLDPSVKADILKAYNKLQRFDFTDYKSSSYFRNKQIPTKEDSVRYNTAAANAARKAGMLSKVTSALTGAKEDYAGYIDNSSSDEASSTPSDNRDVLTSNGEIKRIIVG